MNRRVHTRRRAIVLLAALVGCTPRSASTRASSRPPAAARTVRTPTGGAGPRYFKGQTHAHSSNSGDSATPPADVARWYERHGYDFVVFTDHNFVTVLPASTTTHTLLVPGAEITQNLRTCEPPPEPGLLCLLHVNALFLPATAAGPVRLAEPTDLRREALFGRATDLARSAGALAQLNHPDFHYAADAATLTALVRRGATLLEVANEAVDSNNRGDARHPSTEALWDAVLTAGATVWGVASDDAHHYDDAAAVAARGEPVFTGDRGWVMVRATALEPGALRDAMARGDFYASSGVVLARAEPTADGGLDVAVADASPGPHRIRCIGTGGRVVSELAGRAARCPAASEPGGYVRAVVSDAAGHAAWVQPVRPR